MLDPIGKFFMGAAEYLFGWAMVIRNKYKQTARRLRYWMEARNGE